MYNNHDRAYGINIESKR